MAFSECGGKFNQVPTTRLIPELYSNFLLFAVLIRKAKDGRAELVLLDHGLYEFMQPKDRLALCKLYKAIIVKDEEAMKKHSLEMGVKGGCGQGDRVEDEVS